MQVADDAVTVRFDGGGDCEPDVPVAVAVQQDQSTAPEKPPGPSGDFSAKILGIKPLKSLFTVYRIANPYEARIISSKMAGFISFRKDLSVARSTAHPRISLR